MSMNALNVVKNLKICYGWIYFAVNVRRKNSMSLMDKMSLEELYREYWYCIHVGQQDKADKILELVKRRFNK